MGKPLEMRGWAVKQSRKDGTHRLVQFASTRYFARNWRKFFAGKDKGCSHRYTVVPVVVRERR